MNTPNPTQGWYKDPRNPGMERYWDGDQWSEETRMPPPSIGGFESLKPVGYSHAPGNTEKIPENYLVWAILVTLLCFWPLGIPAIINSVKVDRLWLAGDTAGALEASQKAKKWSIAAGITGGVIVLTYLLILGFIAILSLAAS